MLAIPFLIAMTVIAPLQFEDVKVHTHVEEQAQGPDAFVEVRHVDLGTLKEGAVGTAVFVLENRGKSDLHITNVSASCGCTTVKLSDEERLIKPGESRDIVAKFDSKSRLGKQRKVVTLKTDDPTEPMMRLTLSAMVESLFRVLPRTLINMRSVHRGEKLNPLELFPTQPGTTLSDIDISVRGAAIEHSLEPITGKDGESGFRVNLVVPQRAELGPVTGNMTITAKVGDERASVPVRLAGSVVGNIVSRPVALQSLSLTPRGRDFAPVTIAGTTKTPFAVLKADAGPFIDVNVRTIKPEKEYQIRTTLSDKAPDGPLATMLEIRTDDTTMPLIRVPMFVNVRPRYIVEPPMVLLRSDDNSRMVRIGGGRDAWKITGVSCDDAKVQATTAKGPATDPDGQYVRIELSSSAIDTDGVANVTISTDDASASQINIPVVLDATSS